MVTIGRTVKVKVQVEGGETVVLVCRRPTAPELSKFLGARFEHKGRKVKSKLYPAREEFIDKILVDVEGAQFERADGSTLPLNRAVELSDADKAHWSGICGTQVEGWKDLIPASWKSSAAMTFEDPQPESDDEGDGEGN